MTAVRVYKVHVASGGNLASQGIIAGLRCVKIERNIGCDDLRQVVDQGTGVASQSCLVAHNAFRVESYYHIFGFSYTSGCAVASTLLWCCLGAFHHVSVFYFVFTVKLFVRSFPPVVAPQIEARVAADGLFQSSEVVACDFKLRQCSGIFGHQVESADVMATLWAFHIYVEHCIVHLSHDAFCPCKHGRIMVEEGQPQVNVLVAGPLVGYVSEEIHESLSLE